MIANWLAKRPRNSVIAMGLSLTFLAILYLIIDSELWMTGSFVGWTQALLAGGLLLATLAYTWYTKRQTAVMAKPYLKCNIDYMGPVNSQLIIRNTGTGAAHDVNVEWEIGDYNPSWNIHLIPPEKEHRFPIIAEEQEGERPTLLTGNGEIKDYIDNHGSILKFEAECTNISEQKCTFEETIDTEEAIWGRKDAHEFLDSDPYDDISSSIDDVADAVEAISNNRY